MHVNGAPQMMPPSQMGGGVPGPMAGQGPMLGQGPMPGPGPLGPGGKLGYPFALRLCV